MLLSLFLRGWYVYAALLVLLAVVFVSTAQLETLLPPPLGNHGRSYRLAAYHSRNRYGRGHCLCPNSYNRWNACNYRPNHSCRQNCSCIRAPNTTAAVAAAAAAATLAPLPLLMKPQISQCCSTHLSTRMVTIAADECLRTVSCLSCIFCVCQLRTTVSTTSIFVNAAGNFYQITN